MSKGDKVVVIILSVIGVTLLYLFFTHGAGYAYVPHVKSKAVSVWATADFEVVTYTGWDRGSFWWPGYGGAKVGYLLRRAGLSKNTSMYYGELQRWGDEVHIIQLYKKR